MIPGGLALPPAENPAERWPLADAAVPEPQGGDWPRVSVIVPSFNQGEFIEETIRSVLLQHYPNLELIVMDGGSTDNSVEVIRKYAPWIAYWVSEKDKGQSDAINRGWQRATGDIVAWLNADDVYCPGAIANAALAFQRNPDAGMIYGSVDVIDEHGADLGTIRFPEQFDLLEMLRSFNNIVPSVTMFIRKQAVDAVGALRTDLHYTMDFEFVLRLGLRGRIVRDRAVKSLVRIHGSAKSSIGGPKGLYEMYEAVVRVKQAAGDRAIADACGEGLALACTRLSLAHAQEGNMLQAVAWRLRSVTKALPRANKKAMLALLVPGKLFPAVRKYRADAAEQSVQVLWKTPASTLAIEEPRGNR